MKLIIGIGNPGKPYEKTRHNVGFRLLDALQNDALSAVKWRHKQELLAEIAEAEGAVLVKPATFVNRTGESVALIAEYFKVEPEDILMVCDDINLVFGKMRLRPSGSAGGHHGLESVGQALESDGFARLRIGVGKSTMPKDLSGFVLEKFDSVEVKEIDEILGNALEVCVSWVKEGFEAAQKRLSQLQSNK